MGSSDIDEGRRGDLAFGRKRINVNLLDFGRGFVSKSTREIGRRHHSNDRAPMRPSHCWNAGDTGHLALFHKDVDSGRKSVLVPSGFYLWSRNAEAFGRRYDDLAF